MEIKIQTVGKKKETITWPYVHTPYLKCTHQSNQKLPFQKKQTLICIYIYSRNVNKNKRDV